MGMERRNVPGYHFVTVGYPGLIVHSQPIREGDPPGNPYMLLAAVDGETLDRLCLPGRDSEPGKNPQEWLYVDLLYHSSSSRYTASVYSLYISSTTYWMAADE